MNYQVADIYFENVFFFFYTRIIDDPILYKLQNTSLQGQVIVEIFKVLFVLLDGN